MTDKFLHTFSGVVVYYKDIFLKTPHELYFYKTYIPSKTRSARTTQFRSFMFKISYQSFLKKYSSEEKLVEAVQGCYSELKVTEKHVITLLHTTEKPSESKLASTPSRNDRSTYKHLSPSQEFIFNALSIPKTSPFSAILNVTDTTSLRALYSIYSTQFEHYINLPLYKAIHDFALYNAYSSDEVRQFPEPIRYDSGVSVRREFLDEYSAFIYRTPSATKSSIDSAVFRSVSRNDPSYAAEAILKEGFTLFIKCVQEKKLSFNQLTHTVLCLCSMRAVITSKSCSGKVSAALNSKPDLFKEIMEEFYNRSINLLENFRYFPAECYRKYVIIGNVDKTVYPAIAFLKYSAGVAYDADVYLKWPPEAQEEHRINTFGTKKIVKSKKKSLSQDKVVSNRTKAIQILKLRREGKGIIAIAKELHMSNSTVQKMLKEIESAL